MQDFHRIAAWARAHALALEVRRATKSFPRSGYADLKSQLVRAADSIASNIVEGCAAATRKEFARYLDISLKSTSEVEYRLQLAFDQGILDWATWHRLSAESVEIRKMIYGLRRAVLEADRRNRERAAAQPRRGKEGAKGRLQKTDD